jgi:hypothetical protein
MSSRNNTIELLNETDRLEARLSWQLFCNENDRVVYGDGTGWQPGVPLGTHPAFLADGGCARRMYDIIQDDFDSDVYRGPQWQLVRCLDCDVEWDDWDEPCWNCGLYIDQPLWRGHHPPQMPAFRGIVARRVPMHVTIDLDSEPFRLQAARLARIFQDFGEAALEAAERINGSFAQAMRQAYVTYSANDAEITRHLLAQTWVQEPMAFDVETFETPSFEEQVRQWRAANIHRMFNMNSRSSRPMSITGRMRGARPHFVILDEGVVLMSKTVEVTVDDVTIEIPRNWRQRKIPPAPRSDNRVLDHIVTQHKLRFPQFYREGEPAHDRRDRGHSRTRHRGV